MTAICARAARQIEPDSKWPLLTLARLCEALAQHQPGAAPFVADADSSRTPMGHAAATATAPTAGTATSEGAARVGDPDLEHSESVTEEQRGGAGDSGPAAEARSIYRRLAEVDPLRKGYYQDAADGKAYVVLRALGTA